MTREKAKNLFKRLFPQFLVQIIAVVLAVAASYMLMTWVIRDLLHVSGTYLGATYEMLGTIALTVVTIVSTNTYVYRKRLKEINTLSDAIMKVAGGDFDYKIKISPKEPMAEVYEDFNKMTAELSSVQLLRNDFINSYSHEFKTPIASINGFADLLLEKNTLTEEQKREYLEIIRAESDRLSSLAKNTILLSKITTQQIVENAETYNLGEQIRQCAIICSHSWLEKGQEFEGDFKDVSFTGNRELMQHLWINLLNNAVKYTPNGGQISVSMSVLGGTVVVRIKDSGIGIDEETMKHIFSPYYQGDNSRSVQGLGLGLSIVKRIVELCKGSIKVNSTVGEGSEFIVTLPTKNTVRNER